MLHYKSILYDAQFYLLHCCYCTTVCVHMTQILALFTRCASICRSSGVGLTSFSHSPVLSGDLWGAVPDENRRVLQTGGVQSTAGVQLLAIYGKGVCVCAMIVHLCAMIVFVYACSNQAGDYTARDCLCRYCQCYRFILCISHTTKLPGARS